MRALSVRQPWSWAIVAGGKDCENRSRNIAGGHRGLVAIHAGQQLADAAFRRVAELADYGIPDLGHPGAPAETYLGGVIGVAELTGAHPASTCGGSCSRWADPTGWHLRLIKPRALSRPVDCPGRLGLFELPADVTVEVLRLVAGDVR